MIEPMLWFDREFTFTEPIGAFPSLLERLRGTSARAEELVAGLSEEMLALRVGGKWSAKEHIGHLIDLHSLDEKRFHEFLAHVPALSPADRSNRATEEAQHNRTPMADILRRLRAGRLELVARMEELTEEQVGITAFHPRLQKPMRLLDWARFVAEHDDHHLAKARRAILAARKLTNTSAG